MREGWVGDDYLILFTDDESVAATTRYGISHALPGFRIIGLRGWDDFIVQDAAGASFTVPTVPMDGKYLDSFEVPPIASLEDDRDLMGKIKWYVKPLVFGGDPLSEENVTWVSHDHHAELVVWWNATYQHSK